MFQSNDSPIYLYLYMSQSLDSFLPKGTAFKFKIIPYHPAKRLHETKVEVNSFTCQSRPMKTN